MGATGGVAADVDCVPGSGGSDGEGVDTGRPGTEGVGTGRDGTAGNGGSAGMVAGGVTGGVGVSISALTG